MESGDRKMAKKKPDKLYWVPMRWEHSGGAWVLAKDEVEATAKANQGNFGNGVNLYEEAAELINWEVTGDAKEEKFK